MLRIPLLALLLVLCTGVRAQTSITLEMLQEQASQSAIDVLIARQQLDVRAGLFEIFGDGARVGVHSAGIVDEDRNRAVRVHGEEVRTPVPDLFDLGFSLDVLLAERHSDLPAEGRNPEVIEGRHSIHR